MCICIYNITYIHVCTYVHTYEWPNPLTLKSTNTIFWWAQLSQNQAVSNLVRGLWWAFSQCWWSWKLVSDQGWLLIQEVINYIQWARLFHISILYRTHPYQALWDHMLSIHMGFSNLTSRGAGAETERSRATRGGIGGGSHRTWKFRWLFWGNIFFSLPCETWDWAKISHNENFGLWPKRFPQGVAVEVPSRCRTAAAQWMCPGSWEEPWRPCRDPPGACFSRLGWESPRNQWRSRLFQDFWCRNIWSPRCKS